MDEVASLYASDFMAASPAMSGKNDDQPKRVMAHVAWTATYDRKDLPETAIDFDVHYLVQVLDGEAKAGA